MKDIITPIYTTVIEKIDKNPVKRFISMPLAKSGRKYTYGDHYLSLIKKFIGRRFFVYL